MRKEARDVKNLYGYLEVMEADRWKLQAIVGKFPEEDRNLFYIRCGKDLLGSSDLKLDPKERTRFYGTLLPKVARYYDLLKDIDDVTLFNKKLDEVFISNNTWRGGVVENLIVYFDNVFSLSELTAAIESLPDDEKQLVYKRFGVSLDGSEGQKLTKDENVSWNTRIMPKLKARLKKMYPERAERITGKKGKIGKVDEDKREDVKKVDSNEEFKEEIENSTSLVKKEENNLVRQDYEDIKKIFSSPEFIEFTKIGFSIEQVIVASLFHGFLKREFSVQEISQFLGIEEEQVKGIVLDSIEAYRALVNKKIDKYILELK